MQEETKILDEEHFFGGKDKYGIKELCFEQLRTCCRLGSVEMITLEQRWIFINAVKMFEVVIAPHIIKNKNICNEINALNESVTEVEGLFTSEIKKKYQNTIPEYINEEYSLELMKLYRTRLVVLSNLFAWLNYFDETIG